MFPLTQHKSRPLGAMFNSLIKHNVLYQLSPPNHQGRSNLLHALPSSPLPSLVACLSFHHSYFKVDLLLPECYCLVSFHPSFIMSIVLSPLVLLYHAILCMQFTSTMFLCCLRFDDVIGNGDIAKKLVDWLKRWDAVHLKKTVKVRNHLIYLVLSYLILSYPLYPLYPL